MFTTSTLARNVTSAVGAALIATAFLTVAATPAAAAQNTKVVSYADLNLASEQGRATLKGRIRLAAREVCKADGNDVRARIVESRCINTAVRNANANAAAS